MVEAAPFVHLPSPLGFHMRYIIVFQGREHWVFRRGIRCSGLSCSKLQNTGKWRQGWCWGPPEQASNEKTHPSELCRC